MKSQPNSPRQNVVDLLHGVEVADPYRWLEAADSPETLEWSTAQREWFEHHRANWPLLQHFHGRLSELSAGGAVSAPYWRGARQFLTRREPGQDHAVLLCVEPDGSERVLLDPMQLDPSGTTTLDSWQPSKEGNLLAYQISVGGNEESMLFVIDVASGDILEGPIDRARYSPVAWLPGEQQFYYVRRLAPELLPEDEQQYHRRVYLHTVGNDPAEDIDVLGEGLTITNYYGPSVSWDGRWLAVAVSEGTSPGGDLYWADLSEAGPETPQLRRVFSSPDSSASFRVGRDGKLYVHTDFEAPRGRVCVTSPERPEPEHWVDLLPEAADSVLAGWAILDGAELAEPLLAVFRTKHTVAHFSLHRLRDGALVREIALPGAGSVVALSERPEGGPEIWFVYTDHVNQPTVHRFDARSGETTLWASAPGTVATPSVHTQLVTYRSKDGTEIRMFIISKSPTPDRSRPTILYGYGGFGISLSPAFSTAALAWVEAGGVYAIANLRGGGEEGEEWHRAGMFGNKQNVFDDFLAAGEHLITQGWTTSAQLAVFGGSNGGLLVGAALTQRPDLMSAVVCSAPLLDMVRYELFGLGATWNVEYGSAQDPEAFGWLHAYSPYHRVSAETDYPAVLFTVFDGDSRVDPLHARKLAAALQWANRSDSPILLRAEANVGHGARAVSKGVVLLADQLAFVAHHTGLSEVEA